MRTLTRAISIFTVLAVWTSTAVAGPSFAVFCSDEESGNTLKIYDVNPSFHLLNISGSHSTYGLNNFRAELPVRIKLHVSVYSNYDVTLTPQRSLNLINVEQDTVFDTIQGIVIYNKDALYVPEARRHGAAKITLKSGRELFFPDCMMTGNNAVMDWQETFDQ